MQAKLNLLVVENEDLAFQPIAVMAHGLGHHVIRSEGSEQPIEMLEKWQEYIQLIVLDWTLMCCVYGGALVTELHKIDPCIPFLIVSGYGEGIVKPLLPKTAFVRFLIKPFLAFEFESGLQLSHPKTLR